MFFLSMLNPVLWGVMAGLLHFIPFLGAMVGISVVTLVAAVALDSLGAILLVPATYLALNLLEEAVPFVIGRRLLLNPVVLFVWLIFWGWLWGVPGALMAVPLLAIVKIVCDHVQPLASLGSIFRDAEFHNPVKPQVGNERAAVEKLLEEEGPAHRYFIVPRAPRP